MSDGEQEWYCGALPARYAAVSVRLAVASPLTINLVWPFWPWAGPPPAGGGGGGSPSGGLGEPAGSDREQVH